MTNFLETLRTLDAAATPGPWEKSEPIKGEVLVTSRKCLFPVAQMTHFDADLAIFLRNHAPALIGCVEALERLRDCDWVITPADRMDAVRTIARDARAALEGGK